MKLLIKIADNSHFIDGEGPIHEFFLSIKNDCMSFDVTDLGDFLVERNLSANLRCQIFSKDFVNDDGSELTEEQIHEIGEERMTSVIWAVLGYFRGFRDMAIKYNRGEIDTK